MKRFYVMALLCAITLPCLAQFKLSGKVLNAKVADTLYLNIPYVYGYYKKNNVSIPVDAQGNFSANIKLMDKKFATINFLGTENTLLLTPGKSLVVNLNRADTSIATFKGTAAVENLLLYKLKLEQKAFFFKSDDGKVNPYINLTPAEVPVKIFHRLIAERDARLALVNSAPISAVDKALIAQEVSAQAVNLMSDYVRGAWKLSSRADLTDLIVSIFKDTPPKPTAVPAGPKFYAFADQYIAYLEATSFAEIQKLPAENRNKTPLKAYGVSLDSGNKVVKQKGKLYINWLAARNSFDKTVAEPLLAQYISKKAGEKTLSEAEALLTELKIYNPQSKYLPELNAQVAGLEAVLAGNAHNADIKLIDGFEKMTSVYQVINQLKGKVVYLDIWGTWCGPCKEELTYNPQLKAHFKGKDVVFIYLDMDDDAKDAQWREFLKVNGLTGWHLRKNRNNIQPFWDELLTDKSKQNFYPTYFIFDKTGKLVQAGAKRPSDQSALYAQIEKYL